MWKERNVLLILGILLCGAFCALNAMAEPQHAEAYENLTAVDLAPSHAPRLDYGVAELSTTESHRGEHLPLQLAGAIKKVNSAKYGPAKKPAKKARKI